MSSIVNHSNAITLSIVAFIRNGGLRKAREREQQHLKDRESNLRLKEFAMASLERRLDSGFYPIGEGPAAADAWLFLHLRVLETWRRPPSL